MRKRKKHIGGLMEGGLPWPAEGASLPPGERAELQRQGAKAAARGEPLDANPMTGTLNRPASTGESHERWTQRHGAWQEGHEAHAGVAGAPPSSDPESGA